MLTVTEILNGKMIESDNNLGSPEGAKTAESEMSLADKVLLANHPSIKAALQCQLEDELQEEKRKSLEYSEFQEIINSEAQKTARQYGYKDLKFVIFLHETTEDKKEWKLREGTIVHMHYYGKLDYLLSPMFWKKSFPAFLPKINAIMRTSALIVRSHFWEMHNATTPKWKKIKFNGDEKEFNLLKSDECEDSSLIEIVKRHLQTGIVVNVKGYEKDRRALEREAWVLLSQQVAAYKLQNNIEDEDE